MSEIGLFLCLAHTIILIRALEECIGPISQFFDAVRQLTGWEWTVIGGGPDPHLGGMLNVSRYVGSDTYIPRS